MVAQAIADQASAMAQQESMRNQAEYARQTAIAQAQYQAEIDQAQQTAAQAGPLAAARAQQSVLVERSVVAQKNAELRQAELVAEVVRPAQADRIPIATPVGTVVRLSAYFSAPRVRWLVECPPGRCSRAGPTRSPCGGCVCGRPGPC